MVLHVLSVDVITPTRPENRRDSYFDNSLRLGIENRLKEDLTIISQISFGV